MQKIIIKTSKKIRWYYVKSHVGRNEAEQKTDLEPTPGKIGKNRSEFNDLKSKPKS